MRRFRTKGDGRWFPADGDTLRAMVQASMADASCERVTGQTLISGIAPHAGFAYSGRVAGYTYRALATSIAAGRGPDVVIVLGFSHQRQFNGISWLAADAIQSPLGQVDVDSKFAEAVIKKIPTAFFDCDLHVGEHSAENQIPFVQVAAPEIPVAIGLLGGHDIGLAQELATAIMDAANDRQVFVVASTDLLHDPDYERVCSCDAETLAMMERLDSKGLNRAWSYEKQVCCGIGPVLTALEAARAAGCDRGAQLYYCNSGDIDPSGRGQWVVGYGSVVFACP
jgi:AmmeMemoRadiSam system protein B